MDSDSRADGTHAAAVTMADERIGFNDTVAAAVTRRVGSMPALYVVLVVFATWMGLATWGPLHSADPYPFPFLLFVNNVAQLVLCLIILVGQRVLSAADDDRSIQTHRNTEAIFAQVADLQAHLDRHDRALSRGLSLLESTPHPWIRRHRVQPPPQARDQAVSTNDRIAVWLTRRLGSVWAFYFALISQLLWVLLSEFGIQTVDPYPFAFMAFLSTLAQLIFMIVIMVGQDVLGRTGDRRSEQTFLDAEAILHECRRMKARLNAQDRVIDSLTGYVTGRVSEQLGRALHETSERVDHQARAHAVMTTGQAPADAAALRHWDELTETDRQTYRTQARGIGENLAAIGYFMVPAFEAAYEIGFDDEEIGLLARFEYERRMARLRAERLDRGPHEDPDDAQPLPWHDLPQSGRIRYLQAARRIPVIISGAGFQVLRSTRPHLAAAPAG
ncbi:putative membrane protein [Nocardia nova SH22a]|uniref:Putative membrane protein n=1 Tax=Nocardia nova SH22a TaxID=1415166 RepID=W5TI80_9NOCA|nr:DUF1003 domain-containing protein [Nocardia nova]AHH18937.1 putative membrane protein [Nocardia nova SH22a]